MKDMKDVKDDNQSNLTDTLKELESIAEWFETQEDIDVEKGLVKVKQGADLIKRSRKRLKEVENTFEEIKKEIHEE